MLHQVKNLSNEQRLVVEQLLGRALGEDETVSIKGLRSSRFVDPGLSPEEKARAIKQFDEYFAMVDAARQPVSKEEELEIINEALAFARRHR